MAMLAAMNSRSESRFQSMQAMNSQLISQFQSQRAQFQSLRAAIAPAQDATDDADVDDAATAVPAIHLAQHPKIGDADATDDPDNEINANVDHQHFKIWGADDADDPVNSSGDVSNDTTALFTVLTPGATTADDITATTPAPAGHCTTIEIPVNHIPPNTTPHLCYRAPLQPL